MTYRPIELPPQERTQAYVCDLCSAVVLHPTVHTESHVDAQLPREPRRPRDTVPVPNVKLDAVKL